MWTAILDSAKMALVDVSYHRILTHRLYRGVNRRLERNEPRMQWFDTIVIAPTSRSHSEVILEELPCLPGKQN
jgi:hypothetical protein